VPLYRFEINSGLSPEEVIARIRQMTREQRGTQESFRHSLNPSVKSQPPFIGSIEGSSFFLRQNIAYQNSFLPVVWGRVYPIASGSRIHVKTFMPPGCALFMAFWFIGVSIGMGEFIYAHEKHGVYLTIGMILFGVVLICGGFFPEAFNARRILSEALTKELPDTNATRPTSHPPL
jgi:hypothetical protein